MWEKLTVRQKLSILAGETLVEAGLLLEEPELVLMLKNNSTKQECLDFINDHW
jgi:hypothetical protein